VKYLKIQDFINEISNIVVEEDASITLFIGSGFSIWYGYPSWRELFNDFCNKVYAEFEINYEYLSGIKARVNNSQLEIPYSFNLVLDKFNLDIKYLRNFIVDMFSEIDRINGEKMSLMGVDTDKYHQLYDLNTKYKIITTNYDPLIEDIFFRISGSSLSIYYADSENLNKDFFLNRTQARAILKLHGDVNERDKMIISKTDYQQFINDDKYRVVRNALKNNFSASINIFLGYSLNDENIRQLLLENQNIYGDDKEKSYVFNTDPMNNIRVIDDKELVNRYAEIGVEEILIGHFDELLAVLKHLNRLKSLEDNLLFTAFQYETILEGKDDQRIFMGYKHAVDLCNLLCYTPALHIIESTVEGLKEEQYSKWEPLYCLLGVLLQCAGEADSIKRGNTILNKIIESADDLDRVYSNIGNLYWARSMNRVYNSNTSEKFGLLITDNVILKQAVEYFYKVKNKSRFLKYQLVDAEFRLGNKDEAERLCKKFKQESNYYPKLDWVLGLIIFLKAKAEQDSSNGGMEFYKESINFISSYINSQEYLQEKPENKEIILNRYIQGLLAAGDYEQAKKYCDELMSINPSGLNIHRYLIELFIYEGDYEKAIEECEYELDHTPDLGNNRCKIVYIKAMCIYAKAAYHHEIVEAIEMCKGILAEHEYVDVTHTIGRMYWSIGQFKKLREYTIKACYLDPSNEALYKEAQSHLQGHFVGEEAEFSIQRSFEQLEKLHKHRQNYKQTSPKTNLYLCPKQITRARGGFRRLYVKDVVTTRDFLLGVFGTEVSPSIIEELDEAFYHYNRGYYQKAFSIIKKFKEQLWNNHIFRYVYANILCQENNFSTAKCIYEQILKSEVNKFKDDHKKIIYYFYGECCFSSKDYDMAINYYYKAYQVDNRFHKALFSLGLTNLTIARNHGDIDYASAAASCFEKCKQLEPAIWETYDNLSVAYCLAGLPDEVIRNALMLRSFILPIEVRISNYIRLMFFFMFKEDDASAAKMISEVEEFIDSVQVDDSVASAISLYYYYKSVYYSNISHEKSVESAKRAYDINPNEETRNRYEISKSPATHYLEYGGQSIVRGGQI